VLIESIRLIRAVEDETRHAKLLAQQNARDAIEEARRFGEDRISKSHARAASEVAHLTRAADQKATDQALELASKTANKQATLRARAERRLESAAKLIVERILKS
jgi:V/A-type H+-transporting ATPase subunit G/H